MPFRADEIQPIVSRGLASPSLVHFDVEAADAVLQIVRLRVHQNLARRYEVALVIQIQQFDLGAFDRQVGFCVDCDAGSFQGLDSALRLLPRFELRIRRRLKRNLLDRDRWIGAHIDRKFWRDSITSHDVIGQRLLNA